jgi:hypothetical protein
MLLGSRQLKSNELFKCFKMLIDSSIIDQFSLLVYYPKERLAPGYKVYDIRYALSSVINNTLPSNIITINSTN